VEEEVEVVAQDVDVAALDVLDEDED